MAKAFKPVIYVSSKDLESRNLMLGAASTAIRQHPASKRDAVRQAFTKDVQACKGNSAMLISVAHKYADIRPR